jgi:dihydroorotate dehydrogenase electron transfer subunit
MFNEKCEVLENRWIAPGHFVLRFRSKKIAKFAKPGQFVQILCGNGDFLLPRPFSFLTSRSTEFSVLYHVVGQGTERMSRWRKKDKVLVLGPLGNGFSLRPQTADRRLQKVILIGGGVGIPPLYHLAETLIKNKIAEKNKMKVMLGARHKSLLLCEKDFKKLGIDPVVSTNDGSKGHQGLVTDHLSRSLRSAVSGLQSRIYTCGPTPMLKAVSQIAGEFMMPCEVAVEVPMACGFGACLGCAIKVNSRTTCATEGSAKLSARIHPEEPRPSGDEGSNKHYRYAIACVEGPVFPGADILWD